jgi:hypothetical protein
MSLSQAGRAAPRCTYESRADCGARSGRMKIHLHIGVHKTANTYIKDSLAANQAQLNALGIGFMPYYPFRKQYVTEKLETLARLGARIDNISNLFFADGMAPASPVGLVLSDENFVGHSYQITENGEPLMSGARNLALLRQYLAGHEVTMLMAIRDYGDYIASSYGEALRGYHDFVSFDTVKARLKVDAFDWAAMISTFRQSLRPAHVKIWRFEDARDKTDAIVRAIAFDLKEDLYVKPNSRGRISFSQNAINELHQIAAEAGQEAATKRLHEIRSNYAIYSDKAPFRPWSEAETRQWSQKYDDDCARIDDDLWLIKPPNRSALRGS